MTYSVKRKIQWSLLKTIRVFTTSRDQYEFDPFGREAVKICKVLLDNPKVTLLISPISGKRYLQSEDKQLSVIVEQNQLTIVNHQYSYNIYLKDSVFDKVKNLFDNEVERRRDIMENEIRSNVKHSLSTIYQNLINENLHNAK
jgi:hypothetical protein